MPYNTRTAIWQGDSGLLLFHQKERTQLANGIGTQMLKLKTNLGINFKRQDKFFLLHQHSKAIKSVFWAEYEKIRATSGKRVIGSGGKYIRRRWHLIGGSWVHRRSS